MPKSNHTSSEHTPLETIRLNDRDRRTLMNKINAASPSSRFQAERRALRVDFDVPRILFILVQGTGNQVRHVAVPRNLSKRGLSFILGRYVYADSDCKVAMPNLNGEWVLINGKVRACYHVTGVYHETAVVFEEALELREFAELTREEEDIVCEELAEDLGEDFEDSNPTASVLIVDDDKASRRLLSHWLNKLNLRSREATGQNQALTSVKDEPPDAILMDINLGDSDGLDVVQTLRQRSYKGPIICISSDDSSATRQRAISAGCNTFLAKPYSLDQVQKTLEEAMAMRIGEEQDEPLISVLAEDESMGPLLREFSKTLNGIITKLTEANGASDYEMMERICHQLKGAGGSYGFDIITQQAAGVLNKLEAEDLDLEAIHSAVSEMIRTLRRVKTK